MSHHSSNEHDELPTPITSSSHGMTLRSRIQIIEKSNSEDIDTCESEEVMHVFSQSSNSNDVCINADMIPAHHELEVDDRWGPILLSTINQTSQASSQVIRARQQPEVLHRTLGQTHSKRLWLGPIALRL